MLAADRTVWRINNWKCSVIVVLTFMELWVTVALVLCLLSFFNMAIVDSSSKPKSCKHTHTQIEIKE